MGASKEVLYKKTLIPAGTGYIRRIETWDLYDATVQTFNFTREARTPDGKIESRELPIRTVDDYNVTVDIIIKFQIKRGEGTQNSRRNRPG